MNFFSLLSTVMQAVLVRNYSFPVRIGNTHFQVTITEQSAPSSTNWSDVVQIVLKVFSGAAGTFNIGVFEVEIVQIATIAPSGSVTAAASVKTAGNAGQPTT